MTKLSYNWYILVTRGGHEEKVVEKIRLELQKKDNLEDYVRELKVVSDANKKKILKGYIVCYCHLTPELVRSFYGVPGIISFLNHQKKDNKLPDSVSAGVIKSFFSKLKEKKEAKATNQDPNLNIGDLVKITTGTFADYEGRIAHLDKNKQKAKIIIVSSGWEVTDVPTTSCQKVLS